MAGKKMIGLRFNEKVKAADILVFGSPIWLRRKIINMY